MLILYHNRIPLEIQREQDKQQNIIIKIFNGMDFLSTIVNSVLNTVFPTCCISCGKTGADLCMTCLGDSPLTERESEKWIFPLYDYRHPPIKKAVWLLKYRSKKSIASIFAEVMHGRILEELSDLSVTQNFNNAILIPIPLSKKRYRERGFNQAELICKELIKLNSEINLRSADAKALADRRGVDFTLENNVLIKSQDTKHQAHIENRSERLKNIMGSFTVKNEELIKGRNIILIDDVTTTGATLNEAKKTLKKAGAKKVIAFTVAH